MSGVSEGSNDLKVPAGRAWLAEKQQPTKGAKKK
jgi:hypothetical protein